MDALSFFRILFTVYRLRERNSLGESRSRSPTNPDRVPSPSDRVTKEFLVINPDSRCSSSTSFVSHPQHTRSTFLKTCSDVRRASSVRVTSTPDGSCYTRARDIPQDIFLPPGVRKKGKENQKRCTGTPRSRE